jgi:hypothetical protein
MLKTRQAREKGPQQYGVFDRFNPSSIYPYV